jgi:hypothetical protein
MNIAMTAQFLAQSAVEVVVVVKVAGTHWWARVCTLEVAVAVLACQRRL